MKRPLAILLLVLVFNGVNSVDPKEEDHEIDKLFAFGSEAFLKFLNNVKMKAETALTNRQFNRSGNEMQNLWKSLKELIEKIIAEQRANGNQDDFLIATRIFHHLGIMFAEGGFEIRNALARNDFSRVWLQGILKNETMAELWRDVGSLYFPDAPPVYSDPVGFLSYLLSKIVVKPQMVRNLKVALEVMKIDIDQLYKDAQVAINQVREKALEISALERQTEKNDFAVSMRTASTVLVFYWDTFLEYTKSSPFHDKYIDSIRQWKELRILKNISNSCHSEIEHQALNWAGQNFGNLFNNFGQEYYRWGDGIFGNERFNQSNWAFLMMASVYRLPVYQKLCESGFGTSEVNNLLKTANGVLIELGEDFAHKSREVIYDLWTVFEKEILSQTENLHTTSDVEDIKNPLQHLRSTIKEILFDIWDQVLSKINSNIKEDEVQKSLRHWDEVKTIFMKVLTDSGELTQENLDEAQKTLINVGHMVLEKYVKIIDGLDKRISASIESLGKVTLQTFGATNNILINILLFLLSD